jgi:protein-S-isoprenylcysteine O-methyltransferase Ste14
MHVYGDIIAACWFVFFGVWIIVAFRSGGASMRRRSPSAAAVRLAVVVVLVIELRYADRIPLPMFLTPGWAAAGDALCVAGLAFAIWARLALGQSWGMPMTLHEKPELVTSGPYQFVRHPIYTGVAAMLLGTALVFPPAILPAAILTAYFVFSARREERDMAARFPDAYPAYKQRSKMLVPFLF